VLPIAARSHTVPTAKSAPYRSRGFGTRFEIESGSSPWPIAHAAIGEAITKAAEARMQADLGIVNTSSPARAGTMPARA